MALFVKSSPINANPELVFKFHERPDALSLLIPPWEKVTVQLPPSSLKAGTQVILVNHIGPLKLRWVAEHILYHPPNMFIDVQKSGPFHKWEHRHIILSDGQGGAILRDEVDYELPMGLLGRICAGWFVRSKIQKMFDFRHQVTKRFCETGA